MLERIFSSKTRTKLLTIFLTNPERDFYCREISRLAKITLPSISKELRNLKEAGLIKQKRRGNNIYYQANKENPIYPELKSIIYKTEAVGEVLKTKLEEIGDIQVALIFGSVAKGKERDGSDIDLLIIGSPDSDKIYNAVGEMESNIGREVNFITYTVEEWKKKVVDKSGIVVDIKKSEIIPLIGDINDIQAS
jgi:predicted nucleotidyltransferase